MPNPQNECPHPVVEKWLLVRGLVCSDCLTDPDLAKYPGWKQRLETRRRRSDLARNNFNHKSTEVQRENGGLNVRTY